jgi:protein TonB
MKTKECLIKSENVKLLLLLPIIFLALVVFSLNASGQKATKAAPPSADKQSPKAMTDGAYKVVDVMPAYPGGDSTLLKYISNNTHYPNDAKVSAIQGKVIIRFMVKADGTVSDVSVLKGVSPSLDKEAVRVVGTLPKFSPGKLKGVNVPVWYMVPIQFSIK